MGRASMVGLLLLPLLLPLLHPLMMPLLGVASHLLWFTHTLPVAAWSYRRGYQGAFEAVALSAMLLVPAERTLGAGYGAPAPWETVWALAATTALANVLVTGFAVSARRARHTYETLFEQAPFGILRVTPSGAIRQMNRQARQLLAPSNSRASLGTLATHFAIGDAESGPPWAQPEAGGAISLRTRAPNVRRLVASSVQHDTGDWQIVLRDETNRLQLEAALQQSHKLEAIGRFAASVAHDFNNMLAAILQSNELTLDALPHESPAFALAHETRRAAERAVVLTRRLLTMGRPGEDDMRLLDLAAVVHDVAPMLRRLVGRTVHLTIAAPVPCPSIRADRGHVEQILLNLVVNASDAMPAGGSIDVRVAIDASTKTDEAGPAFVQLSVTDTGLGMDAETRRRIFEPFFTTKSNDRGTGLGLATVATLVERAHGRIAVRSQPQQGTTFIVGFPVDGGTVEPDPAPTLQAPRGTETILLVDDDEDVRHLAARALRGLGYDVVEARRGRDALEYLASARRRPALLVTDVAMPDMDGPSLVGQLRSLDLRIPALYVSAHVVASDDGRGVDASTFILPKPFTTSELAVAVRTCLDAGSRGGVALAT